MIFKRSRTIEGVGVAMLDTLGDRRRPCQSGSIMGVTPPGTVCARRRTADAIVGRLAPVRNSDLGAFLRQRRDALLPGDVGLPAHGRRRARGLRREEVAALAGVSVSWYTWLEQGRADARPSREVLDALARALHLDAVEHDHLLRLAGFAVEAHNGARTEGVPDSLRRLLTQLVPAPAYVIDTRWDFVAWNEPFSQLFPAVESLARPERNLVWAVFAVPHTRTLIGGWEQEARRVLSQFRAETVSIAQRDDIRELVDALTAASPEFAEWWPRHDVGGFESHRRVFHHPQLGRLEFEQQQLVPAGEPDLRVIVHLPLA
jgi:transcriptional regulator with XRE-family HTH domain